MALDRKTRKLLSKKIPGKEQAMVGGGYTSYLRCINETGPTITPTDLETMDRLNISKLNPIYLIEIIINYVSKRN